MKKPQNEDNLNVKTTSNIKTIFNIYLFKVKFRISFLLVTNLFFAIGAIISGKQ